MPVVFSVEGVCVTGTDQTILGLSMPAGSHGVRSCGITGETNL